MTKHVRVAHGDSSSHAVRVSIYQTVANADAQLVRQAVLTDLTAIAQEMIYGQSNEPGSQFIVIDEAPDGAAGSPTMNGVAQSSKPDLFGELNGEGAHQILGRRGYYFTLDGWDRAKTDLQRANIRAQLGLDEDGNFAPAGPGPVGWQDGQLVNTFMVPIYGDAGDNGIGGRKYEPVDGHKSGRPADALWQYSRVRVRARGNDVLQALAEFDASQKPQDD
jgi:hypothetical protein